jgi:hypothetical protein
LVDLFEHTAFHHKLVSTAVWFPGLFLCCWADVPVQCLFAHRTGSLNYADCRFISCGLRSLEPLPHACPWCPSNCATHSGLRDDGTRNVARLRNAM